MLLEAITNAHCLFYLSVFFCGLLIFAGDACIGSGPLHLSEAEAASSLTTRLASTRRRKTSAARLLGWRMASCSSSNEPVLLKRLLDPDSWNVSREDVSPLDATWAWKENYQKSDYQPLKSLFFSNLTEACRHFIFEQKAHKPKINNKLRLVCFFFPACWRRHFLYHQWPQLSFV